MLGWLRNIWHTFLHDDVCHVSENVIKKVLLTCGIGLPLTNHILSYIKQCTESTNNVDPLIAAYIIYDFFVCMLPDIAPNILTMNQPLIVAFVGANGQGKTSTISKLAYSFSKYIPAKKILLIAGDTFRAGARSQLLHWSTQLQTAYYHDEQEKNPTKVIFEGLQLARQTKVKVILIDLAGRVENNTHLMKQLYRFSTSLSHVTKQIFPSCIPLKILVIDALTGHTGTTQAHMFKQYTDIDGVAITKLDLIASNMGITISILYELNIPLYFLTNGAHPSQIWFPTICNILEIFIETFISSIDDTNPCNEV